MTIELFQPGQQYAAPSNAKLVLGGGPLMGGAKLFAVYVDDALGDTFPYAQQMHEFLTFLGGSDRVGMLNEYNALGDILAPATLVGELALTLGGNAPPPPPPPPPGCGCCPPGHKHKRGHARIAHDLKMKHHMLAAATAAQTQIDDNSVQTVLATLIKQGQVTPPDAQTLYLLFFPDTIQLTFGSDASCQTFCGYHNNFQYDATGTQVLYAVLPFPSCAGCLGGMHPIDALTSVVTHEVAEAITDPIPPQGWYDQTNGEIGDICAWQTRIESGHTVQLLWSNRQNSCV